HHVAPRCASVSSQNWTTSGWRSRRACTMPRWMPRPRPWIRRTSDRPASCAARRYSSTTEGMSAGAKACRASSLVMGTLTGSSVSTFLAASTPRLLDLLWLVVFRDDVSRDAAASGKGANDRHVPRMTGGHQVIEDLVGRGLVEDALVAVAEQV